MTGDNINTQTYFYNGFILATLNGISPTLTCVIEMSLLSHTSSSEKSVAFSFVLVYSHLVN